MKQYICKSWNSTIVTIAFYANSKFIFFKKTNKKQTYSEPLVSFFGCGAEEEESKQRWNYWRSMQTDQQLGLFS